MAANPVQTFYSQKAKLYQFFFVDLLQWGKVLETFFQENAYLHSGMKLLDAGCGTGIVTRVLYRLARRNGLEEVTFHAFDLTPAMLDLFREWINQEEARDIHLQQADALDLENQLPDDWTGYDLIVSAAMLEYIPKDNLIRALSGLRQRLKDNGRLLIFITRRTWLTEWTAAKLWRTNLFEPEEIEAELRQAGFTAIQKKPLPDTWEAYMMAFEAG